MKKEFAVRAIRRLTADKNHIADNEQPEGPFSAADTYSIFNSGPDMGFFELETIGGADVQKGQLTGSRLTSLTAFAVFEKKEELRSLVRKILGWNVSSVNH